MTQAESIGLAALVIEKEEETAVSREFRVSEDENCAKGLQYQVWTQIRTLGPPNGGERERRPGSRNPPCCHSARESPLVRQGKSFSFRRPTGVTPVGLANRWPTRIFSHLSRCIVEAQVVLALSHMQAAAREAASLSNLCLGRPPARRARPRKACVPR